MKNMKKISNIRKTIFLVILNLRKRLTKKKEKKENLRKRVRTGRVGSTTKYVYPVADNEQKER